MPHGRQGQGRGGRREGAEVLQGGRKGAHQGGRGWVRRGRVLVGRVQGKGGMMEVGVDGREERGVGVRGSGRVGGCMGSSGMAG